MTILYTIAGLYRPAGMERILSDKANYLADLGYAVTLVTTEQKGRPAAFPLHPSIQCVDLSVGYEDNNGSSFLSKALRFPIKQVVHRIRLGRLLRIERPDVTVSLFCGDERFLPSFRDGSMKVLWVHFSRFKRLHYGRKGLWALADSIRSRRDYALVRRFDRFVTLTEEDLGYWGHPENGCVIPNFISCIPAEPSPLTVPMVLSAGRFCHQKGLDRLLRIWNRVLWELPADTPWRLRLVGDGPMRDALRKQAAEMDISNYVLVDGPAIDMDSVYRDASVYALTSRYEGLPMVLLEAAAYGIPAVAYDCKCGPRDIIVDGKTGFLIRERDERLFAKALLRLMEKADLRREMGQEARARISRWDRETIMSLWLKLFGKR